MYRNEFYVVDVDCTTPQVMKMNHMNWTLLIRFYKNIQYFLYYRTGSNGKIISILFLYFCSSINLKAFILSLVNIHRLKYQFTVTYIQWIIHSKSRIFCSILCINGLNYKHIFTDSIHSNIFICCEIIILFMLIRFWIKHILSSLFCFLKRLVNRIWKYTIAFFALYKLFLVHIALLSNTSLCRV